MVTYWTLTPQLLVQIQVSQPKCSRPGVVTDPSSYNLKGEIKSLIDGPWSSGNSADFDSAVPGSNPGGPAIKVHKKYAKYRMNTKNRLCTLKPHPYSIT